MRREVLAQSPETRVKIPRWWRSTSAGTVRAAGSGVHDVFLISLSSLAYGTTERDGRLCFNAVLLNHNVFLLPTIILLSSIGFESICISHHLRCAPSFVLLDGF
jgi:hypothetical protein